METAESQFGVDLSDGRGRYVHIIAVEFILRILQTQFPVHREARMLRTELGFFKFVPLRDERPQVWFQRFDTMLEQANRVFDLGLSITFPSWMLLSLLLLPPEKWAQLLKDMGHRFPRNRLLYVELQQTFFGSVCWMDRYSTSEVMVVMSLVPVARISPSVKEVSPVHCIYVSAARAALM